MKNFLFLAVIAFASTTNAQMAIGTAIPDASAQLDITSSTKGLLMPRMTLSQRSAIAGPATGLLIFQSDVNPGFYYYNGSSWAKLDDNIHGLGDIKYSYQTADHDGWYLLTGQSKSSLPAAARTTATALGIGANLPDTRDKIVKHRAATGEATGSLSGSNTITLTQNNLPNVSLTTSSAGAHTHSYSDAYWSSEVYGNGGYLGSGSSQDYDNAKATSSQTTTSAGAHTHTIALNGNVTQTTVDNRQASFNLNMFIYLGQ